MLDGGGGDDLNGGLMQQSIGKAEACDASSANDVSFLAGEFAHELKVGGSLSYR